MKTVLCSALCALSLLVSSGIAPAAPAMQVLGKDYTFPNTLAGLPARVSDFAGLQINFFETSDGVQLNYWEAGAGKPLVFIPGWSANGAEFINVMYLLSKSYHVYVLDPRNQGLSQHADWSEQERQDAGGMTSSVERMVATFTAGTPTNSLIVDMKVIERTMAKDSPYFVNSESFAREFVKTDPHYAAKVLFDHATNDWSDVIRHKINVPTAIFSGEYSNNLPSQRWMASVIPNATLYAYTKAEQGDHFLMFKNPFKFSQDLRAFLER